MSGSRSTTRGAPVSGIAGLRQAIAGALQEGAAPSDLLLRLSRRDQAMLKRSPDVATDEIRFSGGGMCFLDVPVADEPAEVSHLDRGVAPGDAAPSA